MNDVVQAHQSTNRPVRRIGLAAGVVALLVASVVGVWYSQMKVPHNQAVAAFNEARDRYDVAVSNLDARNAELQSGISDLQMTIDSEDPPLNRGLLVSAGADIGEAQGSVDAAPQAPTLSGSTDDVREATDEFAPLVADLEGLGDYNSVIAQLAESKASLLASIGQMRQVTNPSEKFVIERLKGLPGIGGVQAVTEGNDPNGNLNKQGGYTATVYFPSTLIDQGSVFGRDIVDRGTEGGGAIEVYRTVEDAKKRDRYLATFDGGPISAGSHELVGTVVIRTSDKLTATQQSTLGASIRRALIKLK